MLSDPIVSVIVPVRNNTIGVRELIRSLEQQTVPRDRFEVIVGDDGSREEPVSEVATDDGWIRVVSGPPMTSYAARNRAARAARGRYLAFCDSDCLPDPTWLEEGLAALTHADIVAGEIRFRVSSPTVWSLLTIDMFLDQQQNVLLSRAVTANLFVGRTRFEALQGFDESLPSGGDYDFARRATEQGARLGYAPAAVVRHPTLDTGGALLRKVWRTNWWAAFRRARAGLRPTFADALTIVPVLGVILARRRALRSPWKLERRRLACAGVAPRIVDDLRAMPILYVPVASVAGLARIGGWFTGRRRAAEWMAVEIGSASRLDRTGVVVIDYTALRERRHPDPRPSGGRRSDPQAAGIDHRRATARLLHC